ncbi:MAG: uroporphyrinogen decarboxylase family protein, partial [Casimicrobium sp.]
PTMPIISFSKGAAQSFAQQAATGVDGLGVDWQADLARARESAGTGVTLQGNFDPAILTTDEVTVRRAVALNFVGFNPNRRYVANLGHGITPDAHPELVETLLASIREASEIARKNT